MVSIGDVVKSRITQLEFERDQLDSYVHQTSRHARRIEARSCLVASTWHDC